MVKILHRMMIALCRDTIILQIKTLLKIGVIQSMVCYLVFLTVLISKQKSCCFKEVLLFGIDTWQVIQALNEKHLTQY